MLPAGAPTNQRAAAPSNTADPTQPSPTLFSNTKEAPLHPMMRTPTFFVVVLLVASSTGGAQAQQDHCVETGNGEHWYADEGRADG